MLPPKQLAIQLPLVHGRYGRSVIVVGDAKPMRAKQRKDWLSRNRRHVAALLERI